MEDMRSDTEPRAAELEAAGTSNRFVSVDGVRIHYLDAPGGSPPIVMLHGLSANAYCFSGLVGEGLSPTFRIIAPDLRGRGRTDKPATGYSMAEHAADVIGLLDALGLDRVILAGHSFGGYVAIYLASKFPERIEKLIVIDAAITLNPRVNELLKPSLDRLTREFGEGCVSESGDLTRHISTVEAAKDMDILRAALGERQLDYLGASYGTFLGATYADLFPTHVRRMVLDGAIDPSLSNEQLSLGQAKGFETALRAYLEDCVKQGSCVLGKTVDEGAKREPAK